MPPDGRVRPIRDNAPETAGRRSVVLPVVGLILAAGGLILLAACVTDLASPAARTGGDAALATEAESLLPTPGLHGRGVRSMERERAVRDHGGCVEQNVRIAPDTTRLAPAPPPERAAERFAAESCPEDAALSTTSDLRCHLAAMAASPRRARFAYVGPR
jgi:hypothetical protein